MPTHGSRFGCVMLTVLCAVMLLFAPQNAEAKPGQFGLSLSVGTGYLVGTTPNDMAPSDTISARNPTLLDLDFQYEALSWLAASIRVEMTVEGGEALTLAPGVIFMGNYDSITVYGRTALAVRVEPNYYGLSLGAGMVWHFIDHLGLVAEVNLEPLFLGDGLTGGFVMPMLVLIGLRGNV